MQTIRCLQIIALCQRLVGYIELAADAAQGVATAYLVSAITGNAALADCAAYSHHGTGRGGAIQPELLTRIDVVGGADAIETDQGRDIHARAECDGIEGVPLDHCVTTTRNDGLGHALTHRYGRGDRIIAQTLYRGSSLAGRAGKQ
ncbi:hypothetical protein D3C79_790670 [compost metagenome]